MNPLEKKELGKTGLRVTRLGLGGAALGGLYQEVPEAAARATVKRALELGINFIDTAPLYGHGKSEIFFGKSLAGVPRSSFVMATKVGRVLVPVAPGELAPDEFENPEPFRPVFDFSYDGVMRSFESSLKRLNLDSVDVLHIHDPDDHYEQALHGAYPALAKLRREGVIKAVGAGMNQAEALARFARDGEFDCFLLAGRYTLIDHTGLKELLPLCAGKGISIIVGGPYNSGILASGPAPGAKFNYANAPAAVIETVRKLDGICKRFSVPMKAAALQFPLGHPAVACVIPGARTVAEVEENFRMASVKIPREFWQELRRQRLLPDAAPAPSES
jgi:D-threo-aldose 1-dehydrogenase